LRGAAMLLKGVNKRVIIIKNPGSEIFEEAYFIVKSGNAKSAFKQSKENEMVIEANRIISDYHNQQRSIIEKNGIASSIGSDMPELDNFLNVKKENAGNINNNTENTGKSEKKINNIEKTDKNKKENKLNDVRTRITDDGIFEDENFFDNIQNPTDKYYRNPDFIGYSEGEKICKPAFGFISSKKIRRKNIPIPPKSFFVGVGFMSAVIILIKLFEFVFLH
jgi:hypothetical protein